MCGIIGMFGLVTPAMEKAFGDMLWVDALRGFHSTGVMSVHRGESEPNVLKCVGAPDGILDNKQYGANIINKPQKVLLGHNRWATKGAVNKANAHPFSYHGITGVHNGSLQQYGQLENAYQFDVDSQALLNHIGKYGIQDAWSKFTGAAALVWWDEADQSINFAKNTDRPMFMAHMANAHIFASEAWMIEMAADRHNLDLVCDPYVLLSNHHLKWVLEKEGVFVPDVIKEALPEKKSYGGYTPTFSQAAAATTQTATQPTTTVTPTTGATQLTKNSDKNLEFEVGFRGLNHLGTGYYDLEPFTADDRTTYRLMNANGVVNTGDIVKCPVAYHISEGGKNVAICTHYTLISSPCLDEDDGDVEVEEVLENTPKATTTTTFSDENGNPQTEANFRKMYPDEGCGWCTNKVNLRDGYSFYHGAVLCHVCTEEALKWDGFHTDVTTGSNTTVITH